MRRSLGKRVRVPLATAATHSLQPVTRRSCSAACASTDADGKARTIQGRVEQPRKRRVDSQCLPTEAKRVRGVATTTGAAGGSSKRAHEAKWWAQGYRSVAGVDEAGRGPLAGPVVAAAVVCPSDVHIDGVDDSKVLTEEQREAAYALITSHPRVRWAVSVQDHTVIDAVNILQATLRAMEASVSSLPEAPDRVLIDGNRMPPALADKAELIVGGDSKSFAIGAASIVAKVTRDRMMLAFHDKWPQYGFADHKGYGVPAHLAALKKHGPCDIHRRSFEPVKSMVGWTRDAAKK
jgi:ribonuclease HII